MPKEWIVQLDESSLEADKNLVMQLIEEIPKKESFLMRSLTKPARNTKLQKCKSHFCNLKPKSSKVIPNKEMATLFLYLV